MTKQDKADYLEKIQDYEDLIKSQAGVLYLKGRPGEAKTAFGHEIAKRNGWQVFDIRLAQVDSAEVAGVPKAIEVQDSTGKKVWTMVYAVPEYLIEANKRPTLIIYDELNRASKETRDAALQIFNERRVGVYQLNSDVYMLACGNLGEADGCEVEEFDGALNNRLIHQPHSLTLAEWRQGYADENVHPLVIGFIETDPEYLYRYEPDRPEYPTPRSWSNLSKLLKMAKDHEHLVKLAKKHSSKFVGSASMKFIHYVQNQSALNINDVLDNYPGVKTELKKASRDKASELIDALVSKPIKKMTDSQVTNMIAFLKGVHPDQVSGFFNKLMDRNLLNDDDMINDPKVGKVIGEFYDIIQTLQRKLQGK